MSGIPALQTAFGNVLVGGGISAAISYMLLGKNITDSVIIGLLAGAGINIPSYLPNDQWANQGFQSSARVQQLGLSVGLPAAYSWYTGDPYTQVAMIGASGAVGLIGLMSIVYGNPGGNLI
ncbi:MAG TPA: hypothetical protein VFC02_09780 [Anaerolineales bacterium]|nr:hypothetical protein [Anaerolineales bacterium]